MTASARLTTALFSRIFRAPKDVMQKIAHLVFIAATLCIFTACTNEEADRERERAQQEQQARQAAEKQRHDAEIQRQAAEKARQDAEKARQEAEHSASIWQTVAWVVSIATMGLFFFGIALGSSARKDAKDRKPPND